MEVTRIVAEKVIEKSLGSMNAVGYKIDREGCTGLDVINIAAQILIQAESGMEDEKVKQHFRTVFLERLNEMRKQAETQVRR